LKDILEKEMLLYTLSWYVDAMQTLENQKNRPQILHSMKI